MKPQVINLKLTILSVVHIGCDDDFEPLNFFIDDQSKLNYFKTIDLISKLTPDEKKKFNEFCLKGNLLQIFSFINQHRNQINNPLLSIDVVKEISDRYKQIINQKDQRTFNEFKIARTIYNPHTNLSYIPGSSIKGALSTAYLNQKDNEKQRKEFFEPITVSDFLPDSSELKRKIVIALNVKKEGFEKTSKAIPVFMEVIMPSSTFFGTITIKKETRNEAENIFNELKAYSNKFFLPIRADEKRLPFIKDLGKFEPEPNQSNLILRIGKHSGAEATSIKGQLYLRNGKKSPTTIWVASQTRKFDSNYKYLSFGWIKLEPTNK